MSQDAQKERFHWQGYKITRGENTTPSQFHQLIKWTCNLPRSQPVAWRDPLPLSSSIWPCRAWMYSTAVSSNSTYSDELERARALFKPGYWLFIVSGRASGFTRADVPSCHSFPRERLPPPLSARSGPVPLSSGLVVVSGPGRGVFAAVPSDSPA